MAELFITAAGGCCLAYYILIVSYAGFHSPLAGLWLFCGCAFVLAAAVLFADRRLHFLKLIPKWILTVIGIAVGAGGLLFLVLFGCVLSKINARPERGADYCIVLGAQIRGESLTRSLRYRLDAALEYYGENPDCIIVASGGQGAGESISEAEAMKRYLMENGVPEENILTEERSTTTNENLRFSYELIRNNGAEDPDIVICSNDFHIFRALKLAEHIGIENPQGLASKSDSILKFNYMVRDSLAIFKEFLIGNI